MSVFVRIPPTTAISPSLSIRFVSIVFLETSTGATLEVMLSLDIERINSIVPSPVITGVTSNSKETSINSVSVVVTPSTTLEVCYT